MPMMIRRAVLPALLALSAGSGSPLAAQDPDLEVFGLAPGRPLAALQAQFAKLGAKPACKKSPAEPRLTECTGALSASPDRRSWSLTASVVDDTAGVLMLRTSVDLRSRDGIREDWVARFGRPNLRKRGDQESYEWIRGGRMLRLSSRPEGGRYHLLATLVDGAVLEKLDGGR